MGSTIKYPTSAAENNIQGIVNVSFTVEKDGTLSDVKTEGKKLGYGTDEEAVRAMKLSKRWNPGLQNGKPARVKYNIPIRFTMPNEMASIKSHTADKKPIVRLTGTNANAKSDVVYIIDGKKEDLISFNSLEPDNIESINILKDANAVALYGKEASNGAIIITTKNTEPALSFGTNKK